MIVLENNIPYIVNSIEDFKDIVSEEVYRALIEMFGESTEELKYRIHDLESEIEDLELEVSNYEERYDGLACEIEDLEDNCRKLEYVMEATQDFLDAIEDIVLDKDQAYYLEALKDKIREAKR